MLIQMIDQTNLILFTNLQEDNKLLGLINQTVSHELRSPLNAIISQNNGTRHNHSELKKIMSDIEQHSKHKKDSKLMQYYRDLLNVQ